MSLSPLRAKKSENHRKGKKVKIKEIILKIKQRRLKAITLQGTIEISPIYVAIAILEIVIIR